MTKSRRTARRAAGKAPANHSHGLAPQLFQTALAHHQRGAYADAEAGYRRLLALDPSQAMVHSNLAAILHETDRAAAAIVACRDALRLAPDHLNAQLNLATAQQKLGDFTGAASTFAAILRRHPQRSDLRRSLAFALERCDRRDEALAIYDSLLESQRADASLWTARAEALKNLGRMDEAIAAFAEAVRLQPDDAAALSSLGILKAMHSIDNNLDIAADLCVRAALLKPDAAPIVNNLGVVLNLRGDTENALLVLRELVSQQPNFAPAFSNIGSILSSRSRYDEAEDAFLEALRIAPDTREAQIELTKVRRHLCDWTTGNDDARRIRALVGQGTNFMIVLMAVSASADEQLAYARTAMAKYNGRARRRALRPSPLRRARIGYISADFRDHPVGRLMPEVIARHDRMRFEVIGYSLGATEMTSLRARFADAFDQFIDLDKVSDADAVSRIVGDEIDILVDLTGPTAGSRFDIIAERPAPIQVSFLGLPGTAGADALDYLIADHVLIPPGAERFYHEAVVRLPHCYQPSDPARRTLEPLPTRTQCGLPETGFVFCSFNSPVKITPEVFDIWMRLLHACAGSVLWLYCKAGKAKDNLLARAEQRGIGAERIIFAGPLPYDMYLSRMTCADLFLDTFPYAAGATCNDALWIGLPVVTCVGETYVSRMAGSLLSALGLEELVTTSLEAYEKVAYGLASDATRLERLRAELAAARTQSPLYDMKKFTKSLEYAFEKMLETAGSNREPIPFDVTEAGVAKSS